MLYVDGMEGVIAHGDTVRWLYALIASKVIDKLQVELIMLIAKRIILKPRPFGKCHLHAASTAFFSKK